ncbi:hypothetical protein BSLG_001748 [Batrachochytrium salamandrivorans]|nr:hypothetical protein BASA62_004712 [Batrachochytrium salamandrivorans]KAH6575065.1 hypothetical protein BASA60_005187 [Batrachochytrium salamandrivorans]KAJ1343673.1 hypothetical protein BSLG_001748 [Batrachochytrium salamandrivorans]
MPGESESTLAATTLVSATAEVPTSASHSEATPLTTISTATGAAANTAANTAANAEASAVTTADTTATNVDAPFTQNSTTVAANTSTEGSIMATTELLNEADKELAELQQKKKLLDKSLANIEQSIYALEGSYLDESQYGNIVRGFDGYLSSRIDRRKPRPTESDRLFSLSSATFRKNDA